MMTAIIQRYHVTALVTRLPPFLLRECEHLFPCFVFLADMANVLAIDLSREFATALCTSISPTCHAGGSDSIDPALFDPHTASLNATVECCCILNLNLSCAVAAEDRSGAIRSDCDEGNWDLAAFGRKADMRLETSFNEMAETVFAIIMLAGSLDEFVDG